MKAIKVKSFAKINLSIDVTAAMDNGFHQVDMIMQQLSFHDDVDIIYEQHLGEDFDITLKTNRYYLPTDERNLAYKAAKLMVDKYGSKVKPGIISINIFKRIPVAAGLAGGSGNGAAVLHGLNALWNLGLSLDNLCKLGSQLGSDVPFCVMGQAKGNFNLPKNVRKSPLSTFCARATGTGTELEAVKGITKFLVIAKPSLGVSTAEVYKGIDNCVIVNRPDNEKLIKDLNDINFHSMYDNFINVLEEYTLNAYPQVEELKTHLRETKAEYVLMSGSGPTVFALYKDVNMAKEACAKMRALKYEAYWTKATR